jgi:glycosyltransferase involved in cell wall biosynthesis
VQLPVFNEIHVLDRLVEAACALRHPRDLLEIEILDDSTDATRARAERLAEAWSDRGFDVVCRHRGARDGYKAGALAGGLEAARGEFIAVFDADFVPPPDFLERTLPWFSDERVGMVQARWGHLNEKASALTRAQALMLDAHFRVEQAARFASGRCFNFNGTAGVFRRRCIEEAGGWQHDTLTEDLDLSYRAQIAGWRFVYLDDLICPAELPADMNALRSQQHRWAKGSIQTARKILPRLVRSRLGAAAKVEAAIHLLNNAAYLLLFAASILLIPSLALRARMGWRSAAVDLAVFLAGTCSFALYAAAGQRSARGGIARALSGLPVAMAIGAGLALTNALAVIEALLGVRSGFRRTPKTGLRDGRTGAVDPPGPAGPAYRGEPSRLAPVELALAVVFTAAIAWAWRAGLHASIPFLALFGTGYGYVSLQSLGTWPGGRSRSTHRRRDARPALGGSGTPPG